MESLRLLAILRGMILGRGLGKLVPAGRFGRAVLVVLKYIGKLEHVSSSAVRRVAHFVLYRLLRSQNTRPTSGRWVHWSWRDRRVREVSV